MGKGLILLLGVDDFKNHNVYVKSVEWSGNTSLNIPNSGRSIIIGIITEMNDARGLVFQSDYHTVTIINDYYNTGSKYTFSKTSGGDLSIQNNSSANAKVLYMMTIY